MKDIGTYQVGPGHGIIVTQRTVQGELLSDDRVDENKRDLKDQTAEDYFKKNSLGTELQRARARMLFQNARDRGKEVSSVGKIAILIGNKNYQGMQRLDG